MRYERYKVEYVWQVQCGRKFHLEAWSEPRPHKWHQCPKSYSGPALSIESLPRDSAGRPPESAKYASVLNAICYTPLGIQQSACKGPATPSNMAAAFVWDSEKLFLEGEYNT